MKCGEVETSSANNCVRLLAVVCRHVGLTVPTLLRTGFATRAEIGSRPTCYVSYEHVAACHVNQQVNDMFSNH